MWEAGRSPHPDTIEALERMFGSRAPRETPVSTDAGLAQMIAAQTEVLREIRDLLADLRGSAPSTDIRRLEAVVGEEARASLESRLEAEDGPATGAREGELQRTP